VSAPATGPGTAVTDEFAANAIARSRPIAILGAGGRLGRAFLRHCHFRGLNVIAVSRRQLDIATPGAARKFMERTQPAVVINCAGYRHIDQAERAADVCGRENVVGLRELAATCAEARVPLATFSSDQVFCGQADRPHVESDAPDPVNEYGRSKLRAEIAVRELCPDALILRLGALFSLEDEDNFLSHVLRSLSAGRPVKAPAAWVVSPVFLPDLVDTVLDLVIDQEKGIWHVANQGSVSWFEWATRAAALADLDGELVREAQPHEMGWMAPRPKNAALASERGTLLPPWEEAVARFVAAFPRLTSGDVAA
jgi:dTDP-4-dehydrorhamnose reductase